MWHVVEGIYKGKRYFYLFINEGLVGMYKERSEVVIAANEEMRAA